MSNEQLQTSNEECSLRGYGAKQALVSFCEKLVFLVLGTNILKMRVLFIPPSVAVDSSRETKGVPVETTLFGLASFLRRALFSLFQCTYLYVSPNDTVVIYSATIKIAVSQGSRLQEERALL